MSVDNLWMRERIVIENGIHQLGLSVSRENVEKLQIFLSLLEEWNRHGNLTGYRGREEMVTELILDSLGACPHIEGKRLIDVGTGAGIPGIPLKIVVPTLELSLVESQGKKVRFLEEAIRMLRLFGVLVHHGRAEEFAHQPLLREQFDTVTAKALAPFPVVLELTTPFLKVGGLGIYYKGRRYREEIRQAYKALELLRCTVEEVKEITVPFLERKTYLVLVRKNEATPLSFPRKAGIPQKRPLR